MDRPNSVFDEAMAVYGNCIVPQNYDPSNPVGTGPFKYKSFRPGEQMVFDANKDYWGQVPAVDAVTIIEFKDAAARVNALLGGSVEAISQLPAAQVNVVKGQGMNVLDATTGAWQPFTMRIDQKPFNDVKVRQAFRLIVDRQAMVDQAYAGFGWIGNDMYAPFDPGYPKDLPQRAQDLEQAKSLLQQAGYNNDLVVELTTSEDIGSAAVPAAQVFAEQAKGAGVTVNVNKVDHVFYGDNYLKWTFAQDFWYTRNYLAPDGPGHHADGALQRDPLEELRVAVARAAGLQDRRQDEARRTRVPGGDHRVQRRRAHRVGLQQPDRRLQLDARRRRPRQGRSAALELPLQQVLLRRASGSAPEFRCRAPFL